MKAKHKLAIHELLNRAAYYFDIRDLDGLKSCFKENANMLVNIADGQSFGPFEGRHAIIELMSGTLAMQTDTRRHIISDIYFESGNDKQAVVVSTLLLTAVESGEIRLVTSGVYRDTVEKSNGQWKFANRHLDLDMPF